MKIFGFIFAAIAIILLLITQFVTGLVPVPVVREPVISPSLVENVPPIAADNDLSTIYPNPILNNPSHGIGMRPTGAGIKKIKWNRIRTVRKFDRDTRDIIGPDFEESS